MPELPEVEVVRGGLARHLLQRTVTRVEIFDPRPLRKQDGGAEAFVSELKDRRLISAVRRGKFLWLKLDDDRALSAHLGMSGQLLVRGTSPCPDPDDESISLDAPTPEDVIDSNEGRRVDLSATALPSRVEGLSVHPRHRRVRVHLTGRAGDPDPDAGAALDLVDQRMFGGLRVSDLVPTSDGGSGGYGDGAPLIPIDAAHIARDLLDPVLDLEAVAHQMRRSRRAVKTLLMDQQIVSGVGNIYADEGLWAARLRGYRPGNTLGPRVTVRLLEATAEVMRRALAVGGTSFDALYVNAEGAAGYFARQLQAYGRQGLACGRCGELMKSQIISGRSHSFCPHCQR